VYLVLGTLGLPFDVEEKVLDESLPENACQRVFSLVEKRIARHIPVAYLINQSWFCGLPFYVDDRVLIPRSPIAELIENRFSPWLREEDVSSILDIGTGSGCIAIACACAFPNAEVDAVDNSNEALAVVERNIERHEMSARVNVLNSDVYSQLGDRSYDLIVANPPYVGAEELSQLPREYGHEPIVALQSGEDGLDIVRILINESGRYLKPGGILVVEVGYTWPAVIEVFPDVPFMWFEFERGGEGVFMLTADHLKNYDIHK